MSLKEKLEALEAKGRLRKFTQIAPVGRCTVVKDGVPLFNLSSNDYLGIATNSELQCQFYSLYSKKENGDLLRSFGLGASSSRLLSGSVDAAHKLEDELCAAYSREAALLFNSGYHLNIGVLPALMQKGDLILSDKLNHASIHDGFRLSPATTKRFNHSDYNQLRNILLKKRNKYNRAIIVTESVFSMDGDVADLELLVQLKQEFDCLLYVDEAHSVGLYGVGGLGKCEELGLVDDIDLITGTFGKAYGSVGAFVICSEEIKQYLINSSRSLIFTTALPPINYEWNRFSFKHVSKLNGERKYLQGLSQKSRKYLVDNGLETFGETNIIPVIIGDDKKAVDISTQLEKFGYLVLPVRPPAVPEGTARLRLSLSASMKWLELESFFKQLVKIV